MKIVVKAYTDIYDSPNGNVLQTTPVRFNDDILLKDDNWVKISCGWIHCVDFEEISEDVNVNASPFEKFIEAMKSKHVCVRIFIVNGFQQIGFIDDIDYLHKCLFFKTMDENTTVIMFSAISTIAINNSNDKY